jgi:hypothetical protein
LGTLSALGMTFIDRLIFDGPVLAPFKVLEVDAAGYLWAIAGQEKELLVIRKYKLVRE